MKRRVILAAGILLALTACSTYRTLRVDILEPATLTLGGNENKFVFADRAIVHEGDTLSAPELWATLGVTRAELVSRFFSGLQEGLRWGVRGTAIERIPDPPVTYAPDSIVPSQITRGEALTLAGDRGASHLFTVEYCKFRLVDHNRVELENNMLLRVYDAITGELLDTLVSDRLPVTTLLDAGDYRGTIREYFYQKGWSFAEYVTPAWIPAERRVYTGNKLLNLGLYLLETNRPAQAWEAWSVALERGPFTAARAAVNMAWLLEREGEFEEAATLLEETIDRLGQRRIRASLLRYILQRIDDLGQRAWDDEVLEEQL
ncbi:MAG: DUF6340 family protein [Odoribacteraceae bacterium]|jgi:hypothetical protein|nr:DUF6340 family protein [Odoribacteraceae bacterium]